MSTYELLGALELTVEGYRLDRLRRDVSSGFERLSTVVVLEGAGESGVGEDVTYDAVDHEALWKQGAVHPLAGTHTVDSFSRLLEGLDLFGQAPRREVSRLYRRWGFESAALDLALRQAGCSLAQMLGRTPAPVRFVVSLRLPEPPSIEPLRRRLELYPDLRFKLDPTSSWDPALIAALAATGAVDSVDLKGMYRGSIVDQGADPVLYGRIAEAFPEAWIEDPALDEETDAILLEHRQRITWDAPIHSVGDIEALPFAPRMVNIKPSRFGSVAELFAAYDFCAARGIGAYGGGQFELGPGRGQIQYLASLFHPDAPNDIAPSAYNDPETKPGLPSSPLRPAPAATGFRWGEGGAG